MRNQILFVSAVIAMMLHVAGAFTTAPNKMLALQSHVVSSSKLSMAEAEVEADPTEVIGRRIIVSGDVDGGYVRTCINNEAGRFRRLLGVMTPPDGTRKAEIYVEGKRKQVEAFVRWCNRGSKSVGLSQKMDVLEVLAPDRARTKRPARIYIQHFLH